MKFPLEDDRLAVARVPSSDDRTSFEGERLVQTDYAARWPELTPPTLSECEAFLAVVEAV